MNLGQRVPPQVVLLNLFQKITSRDYWNGVLWARCPSYHRTVSVKALKGTQLTGGLASSFLRPPQDNKGCSSNTRNNILTTRSSLSK